MPDLTPRADCHASGTGAQYAAIVKDDLEPVFLCYHHTNAYADELVQRGWTIVLLNEKVPA